MTHDIFISYSHFDKVYADKITNYMENNNLRCWYAPRDISSGMQWATAITLAIESAKVFLLILSKQSNLSNQVYNEVNLAVKNKLTILTVKIEDVELQKGLDLYLNSMHWMDMSMHQLDMQLETLLIHIKNVMSIDGGTSIGTQARKLDYYIKVGDYGLAKIALETGDNPEDPIYIDLEKNMPLHHAVKSKDIRFLQLLLPYVKQIDCQNNEGETPLMLATSETATKLLLEKGADVNLQDNSGKTALMYHCGNTERLLLLLKSGAKTDSADQDGNTALHHASYFIGNPDAIKLLVQYGAKINARNKAGETPLGRCTILQSKTKKLLISLGGIE